MARLTSNSTPSAVGQTYTKPMPGVVGAAAFSAGAAATAAFSAGAATGVICVTVDAMSGESAASIATAEKLEELGRQAPQ